MKTLFIGIAVLLLSILLFACNPAPMPASSPTSVPTAEPNPVELVLTIQGGANPLDGPVDLDVDANGDIYILDSLNNRVQVYDARGNFLRMWGSTGEGEGQFNLIAAEDGEGFGSIALDGQGNVYVADRFNQRIQKIDTDGQFLLAWSQIDSGSGFSRPYGVAVDEQGNVYVMDDRRSEIVAFDGNGQLLARWGESGEEDGQFNNAGLIFVAPDGSVYVADFDNNRIQKFDAQGQFLAKWGTSGSGDGELSFPNDVALDAEGNMYIADWGNHRIQVLDPQGNFLMKWGSQGSGENQFNQPTAVVVDAEGFIYVADYRNDRVLKFQRK